MPPKRTPEEQSGAQKKRQRMREQRTIPVEQARNAGRAGGSAGSGNAGLPPTIEVEKFAQARSFEISAMQRSMRAAKEAGTQRAFQSLPRHLRRRAASHNIRRLPERLRKRALAEVPKDAAKPKRVSRKMLGKHRLRKRPGLKAEMFLKRQQKKIWLESHVWHAKRMHMTEIWGHRLAQTPTAKSFRSSYRATRHGCLVHDASYYQYLRLSGPFSGLAALLQAVCDPAVPGPAGKRYAAGAREWEGDLYEAGAGEDGERWPRGLIGPAAIVWMPASSSSSSSSSPDAASSSDPPRTLLLRLHPALASSALTSLRLACASLSAPSPSQISLTPLTRAYNTFELTGSRATEVLRKVLRPVKGTDGATKGAWRKLGETGPEGVPRGLVMGMEVYDPRLSFPPSLPTSSSSASSEDSTPLVPSPQVAAVPGFWDDQRLEGLKTPRYRKCELDRRRGENLIPGTPLTPLAQDDRVPILLTQRVLSSPSLSSSSPSPSTSSIAPPPQHGYTLHVPSGWSNPFLSSLVFSTPRIGGLLQRSQSHAEAGASRFPEDYVTAPAYAEHEQRRESEERGYWERRPPAKRCSWGKVGTPQGWAWRMALGEVVEGAWARAGAQKVSEEDEERAQPWLVPPQVASEVLRRVGGVGRGGDPAPPNVVGGAAAAPDFALLGPKERLGALSAHLFASFFSLSASTAPAPSSSTDLLRSALVRVRLTPLARGVPADLGLVYETTDEAEAMRVWGKVGPEGYFGRKEGEGPRATGEFEGAEDLCPRPSVAQTIGRITTGAFALSSGHGSGVAVVSLYRLMRMQERGLKPSRSLVLFRNRDSETMRAASVEVM
ncbi:hypothetical protein JCM10207_006824 [Rhodosporidiobolus poonsookiae]